MHKNLSFYFIRHGETQWNRSNLFQGSSDSPLTDLGIQQSLFVQSALKSITFSACYSSYQKRAVDTAKNIIAEQKIPLFFHEGLLEIHFGLWEGQYVPDFQNDKNFHYFEHDAAFYSTKDNLGETYDQMLMRSLKAIDDIIMCHTEGNILVVSHGALLRQLIYVLTGGNWSTHLQNTERLNNCSISIVNYHQTTEDNVGKFHLKLLNCTDHILEPSF